MVNNEVGTSLHHFFKKNIGLHPGSRSPNTHMRTGAERQMLFDASSDIALFGIFAKNPFVPIDRSIKQQHLSAFGNCDIVPGYIFNYGSNQALDRSAEAPKLGDRVFTKCRIGSEPFALIGIAGKIFELAA